VQEEKVLMAEMKQQVISQYKQDLEKATTELY
jgi:hypothetical protein